MKNFFKRLTPADVAELICFILFIVSTIIYFIDGEPRLGFSTIITILWLISSSLYRRENDKLRKEIQKLKEEKEIKL